MPFYRIRLVCDSGPDPLSGETFPHAEETLSVEAASLWQARSRAISQMTIRPMGRLLRVLDADSGEPITPPPLSPLREGSFAIDGLDGIYSGYTRDEKWNGFAVPYFPLAEALRVAADYAAQEPTPDGQTKAEFDEDSKLIRLYDPSVEAWDEYDPTEVSGLTLYEIGTRYWTWEEVDR